MASESAIPAMGLAKRSSRHAGLFCPAVESLSNESRHLAESSSRPADGSASFSLATPNFDGDELPVFLSFLLVPVTANGRGLLSPTLAAGLAGIPLRVTRNPPGPRSITLQIQNSLGHCW